MPTQRPGFAAPNDPVLTQIASPISPYNITSSETEQTIEFMLDKAYGQQKDRSKPILVGLAAPQVGISKRIILVDIGADGHGGVSNLQVYINPEIIYRSPEENEWYEGCYSTDHVCGIVSRPTKVTIKAYKPSGIQVEESYEGYTARIFQHEIDHLDGKDFITHIHNDANLHWVEEDEFPSYRNKEAWRNWPHKCPREKWNKIKGV